MATEAQKAALRRHYAKNPDYYKQKAIRVRKELRQLVLDAKAIPCMDCGIQYPTYVMDFDHRGDKEGLIAQFVQNGSRRKLLDEMAKCDVVCSNCHRERTWQRATSS